MQFEKEIKILDIDKEVMSKKLEEIGATFLGKKKQFLYTYDVPTIWYRFLEIKQLLQSESLLIYETNLRKLKNLLIEAEDIMDFNESKKIREKYDIAKLDEIINQSREIVMTFVNDEELNMLMERLLINPNKWIRLRCTNGDKTELTIKHIFNAKENSLIEKVMETEISTSSFEETNKLLEAIGICKRNYQEKERYSYSYDTAKIEIDVWPMLKPYLEIECEDEMLMKEIVKKLECEENEIVSCNTEKLYQKIGIDIISMPELKF